MPSQTCENAYFLKKTRFFEKLKIGNMRNMRKKNLRNMREKKNFKFFINFNQLEN